MGDAIYGCTLFPQRELQGLRFGAIDKSLQKKRWLNPSFIHMYVHTIHSLSSIWFAMTSSLTNVSLVKGWHSDRWTNPKNILLLNSSRCLIKFKHEIGKYANLIRDLPSLLPIVDFISWNNSLERLLQSCLWIVSKNSWLQFLFRNIFTIIVIKHLI